MAGEERAQVPDAEARVGVRRSDGAQAPCAVGREVVGEPLGAGHLGQAVDAGDPSADRAADRRNVTGFGTAPAATDRTASTIA